MKRKAGKLWLAKVSPKPAVKLPHFIKILPNGKWQIFLDATMAVEFAICEQLFEYRRIECIGPKGDRPFVRDIGSWWSKTMEWTYSAFAKGLKLDAIQVTQLGAKAWNDLDMDALKTVAPKQYERFGGQGGMALMIARYAESQLATDYRVWKVVSAEAGFGLKGEVVVAENDRVQVCWIGKPDLFVLEEHRLMPVDHKTIEVIDGDWQAKYKPNIQLPGYIIAGQTLLEQLKKEGTLTGNITCDRCVVNVCARTEPTDKPRKGSPKPRFARAYPDYNPSELEEWRSKRLAQADRLRTCLETGTWMWNEYACTNIYNKVCPFRDIDAKNPGVRSIIKQANFIQVEPWTPYKVEEKK